MSETFEPVYYVSEHGRVHRNNSGSRVPIPSSATGGTGGTGLAKKQKNLYVVIPKDVEESMKVKLRKMNTANVKQSNSNNSFNIHDHKGYSLNISNFTQAQARNTLNLKSWCDSHQ